MLGATGSLFLIRGAHHQLPNHMDFLSSGRTNYSIYLKGGRSGRQVFETHRQVLDPTIQVDTGQGHPTVWNNVYNNPVAVVMEGIAQGRGRAGQLPSPLGVQVCADIFFA